MLSAADIILALEGATPAEIDALRRLLQVGDRLTARPAPAPWPRERRPPTKDKE